MFLFWNIQIKLFDYVIISDLIVVIWVHFNELKWLSGRGDWSVTTHIHTYTHTPVHVH